MEQNQFSSSDNPSEGYNHLNEGSFFARILKHLKSSRNVLYEKSGDQIKIHYFWVPAHDLKKNWPAALWFSFCFGLLPFLFGIFVLANLLSVGNEEGALEIGYMIFFLLFCFTPPIFVYLKLIKIIFAIRTVILDSYRVVIQDSFFGSKPKIKLALSRQRLRKIEWRDTSFLERLNKQKNIKLFLIYDKGKARVISTYREHDLLRVREILEKYTAGETIAKTGETIARSAPAADDAQKESEHIRRGGEAQEYSIYRLLFLHIFGRRRVPLAPLIRYLGANAVIGALGLLSVIVNIIMSSKKGKLIDAVDINYILLGTASIVLLTGWLLNKFKEIPESTNRKLLGIGGLIIFTYACWMLYSILPGLKETLTSASSIRYAPGFITVFTTYGFWLLCEFSPLQVIYKTPKGKWLPRIVFICAVVIDIYMFYLFFTAIDAKMFDRTRHKK